MEELDTSSSNNEGRIATLLNQFKCWFLSHAQYINFFTILLLASVPNPLFDLAGIMCGQFGIPFWEFFLATMIGKTIIKTHIQDGVLTDLQEATYAIVRACDQPFTVALVLHQSLLPCLYLMALVQFVTLPLKFVTDFYRDLPPSIRFPSLSSMCPEV